MTRETRQRIRAYGRALPGKRERVGAAFVMLMIAVITAATATYAWVTLSRSPEVSNITTTLSANGNLEIALSKEDGSLPDEFDIDESVTASRDVTVTNLQWGNLVNLADDSYGIENIPLRPAQLNKAGLLTSPLWGAVYGSDGRITNLDSNYAYTVYDNDGKQFMVSSKYGVRAISSYVEKTSDATLQKLNDMINSVVSARSVVDGKYAQVKTSFSGMSAMISRYAQDLVNQMTLKGVSISDGTGTDTAMGQYLDEMLLVYHNLQDAYKAQGDVYLALANLQLYQWSKTNQVEYAPTTWEQLVENHAQYNVSAAGATSQSGKISLTNFSQFIADKKMLETDVSLLEQYYTEFGNGDDLYWSHDAGDGTRNNQLDKIVDRLIDFSKTMYIDIDGNKVYVSKIDANAAMSLLGADGQHKNAYIESGLLKRFEQQALDDSRMQGKAQCKISVTAKISFIPKTVTVIGDAWTTATGTSYVAQDLAIAQGTKLIGADAIAQDTYGMAIDMWVRTNAEQTCLTLEGATTTDESGNIMSYDGINRVWGSTGESVLTTDSTTQGGGSCYIYYADTPEDMMRSLDLLNAMKVAFVSRSGQLLATAGMDTGNYYAVNGRITVPLTLDMDTQTTYTYFDKLGQEQIGRAITTLTTDNPERITVILYLDGTMLTNDDVLAAQEIQGQLNIQFGSSENLKTIGSNDLIDDIRSVTASVSKTQMDYDAATSNEELTTDVTVSVQGTDPKVVTAFFVRAINSTQGSREQTMTFTKQADGSWKSSYKFTAPGTYYLRHVRLDGVDYALADPPHVEVAGFALKSLTWSEMGDSAVIRTSANTYPVSVSVEFAASDRSKLPSSVQARFVRTDGNTVNIPLMYNSNSTKWEGTGTFSTSGVYTLEYLVLNNKYKDLASLNMTKTLDLSLGIYAVVVNSGGSLTDIYEEGRQYSKDVSVKLLDNTGNMLTGLEDLWLEYSNGGSATNTVPAKLTWNHNNQDYSGTLPFTRAGRYVFYLIKMDNNNNITRATESPVYTIISPDPPVYNTTSECSWNGDNIQFVPLTNDAVIDNIKIDDAASATAAAVVYNSETRSYYTASMSYTGNENKWYAALPTYQVDTEETDAEGNTIKEQSQEGTWSVVAIKVWDCYDKNSAYREETNPILWAGTDEIATDYLSTLTDEEGNSITPDESFDFSKLSTTVSGKLNVEMVPGTTNIGSSTDPFGRKYSVGNLGMHVELTDGAGRPIPSSKVSGVELLVNYNPPADGSYAYNVKAEAKEYKIKLDKQDAEDGIRLVSSTDQWQYVGEYAVQKLTVTVKGSDVNKVLEFGNASGIGVPEKYTVITAGPTVDNIWLDELKQAKTTFGKDNNGNITGTFLDNCELSGTSMKIALKGEGGEEVPGAEMPGLTANLKLTYKNGSQANGGYTFAGNTGYESLDIPMTKQQGNSRYVAGSSVLLAGTYTASIEVNGATIPEPLSDISVYSMKPDVTMTAVNPEGLVTVNADGGINSSINTFEGNNLITDEGRSAVVYVSYAVNTKPGVYNDYTQTDYIEDYADYTLPTLTFKLDNAGSTCKNFTMSIPNSASATFTGNGYSGAVGIGTIQTGKEKKPGTYLADNGWGMSTYDCEYEYETEKPITAGNCTISTLSASVGNATYSITLDTPLSIIEKNNTPPSITFMPVDGFQTPNGQTSQNGKSFTFTLPSSLYTNDGKTSYTIKSTDQTYYDLTTSGEDPKEKIKGTIIKGDDSMRWSTVPGNYPATYSYTLDYTIITNKDDHSATKFWITTYADSHQKKWIQQKYKTTSLKQVTADYSVTVTGHQEETTILQTSNKTYQLDYWLVDGARKQPGQVITVTGNSVVYAHLKEQVRVVQEEKTINEVDGKSVYTFVAYCDQVKYTEKDGEEDTSLGNVKVCQRRSHACGLSHEENAVINDNSNKPSIDKSKYGTDPVPINSISTGYQRDVSKCTWQQKGDGEEITGSSTKTTTVITTTYNEDGTTSVITRVYDTNGTLIDEIVG